jgi:hypothetical protein
VARLLLLLLLLLLLSQEEWQLGRQGQPQHAQPSSHQRSGDAPPSSSGAQYLSTPHQSSGMISARPVSCAIASALRSRSSWWFISLKWPSRLASLRPPFGAALASSSCGMSMSNTM